jgi:hypothetical protein
MNVCATRDQRLFAAVPPQNENHSILSGSFRTAAPARGAMPAQAYSDDIGPGNRYGRCCRGDRHVFVIKN